MYEIYIVKDNTLVDAVKIKHEPPEFVLYRGMLYQKVAKDIEGKPIYNQRQYLEIY